MSDEWRCNETLVLAAWVSFSFFSIQIGATGLFFEPQTTAFGWSRSGPSISVR